MDPPVRVLSLLPPVVLVLFASPKSFTQETRDLGVCALANCLGRRKEIDL